MSGTDTHIEDELEALLEFLYIAPIGLAQTRCDGSITMLNPLCAQLLMPFAQDGELSNLFTALQDLVPDLQHRTAAFAEPSGRICDGMLLAVRSGAPDRQTSRTLSLTLLKLDADRLMAVLDDVTGALAGERAVPPLHADLTTPAGAQHAGKLMSAAASSSLEGLMQFLYLAPIGLVQTTLDGEITLINPMSAQLLMPLAPHGELHNIFDLLAPVAPGLRTLVAGPLVTEGLVCEGLRLPLPAADGRAPSTLALNLLRLDASTLMASLSDITAAVQSEQQRLALGVRDAGRTDSLTGLPNRAAVLESIALALQQTRDDPGRHVALLFINGDRFGRINVTLGQAAGDALLRQMARRLAAGLRPLDSVARPVGEGAAEDPSPTNAARLGSDEFVVVLDGLRNPGDVHPIAQRLIDRLNAPYSIDGQTVHAGASIGVVLPAPGSGADAALDEASLAMRAAKRAGGGRYRLFEPGMKERAQLRGCLEADLRLALDDGQLFVVYQPIVCLRSGRPQGVEALVRWRHPVRGMVQPLDFIEIAEETGLIGRLGLFVLREACRQFTAWPDGMRSAAPQILSVNLSLGQLLEPGLVAAVQAALQDSGLPAAQLQLEVTESMAAQDARVQSSLHALRALGLRLALDDFGTGYSSLARLSELPIDVVKIDRSFVSQLETSPHHRVLVQATVMVARSLGLSTVAEGVETAGQAELLRALRCDKAQGFMYARPMPGAEAGRWLAAAAADNAPAAAAAAAGPVAAASAAADQPTARAASTGISAAR